ncbi:hypothetical protein Aple_021890 [Acrocarpospora pleiomorpha]|uniref:NACHT domain-containing protein n=1 Tax=Acrocarpospora pleiomorpha TaxID=90975 RepID=A0A5M3XJK0_9ACTN|nr:hypothetical protein [Acrocarpospora pleiomorpha]GES19293.1 hypothetical protein Aple_021890 [Acrocarpospora pleiomorpha]
MKSTVRYTGDASGGWGSYVNTGSHYGDVHLAVMPPAQSAYREQVEQIFPWRLVGREAELAELTAFCMDDHNPAYVWWQGPAWAGKSALMATFVLNPPPGIRVVSFFITARYAGHSNRNAFLDVVIEQLAELLGQPMPPLLTEATQRGWFGRLLKDAARLCCERGERLVLLVDGLDEDRGVTVGPGAHSIAALLPAVPPEGLRVIVAGRSNPPVPSDVPARHPLRDREIVRVLSLSPEAQVIRDDAERELDHLLYGGQSDRNLLGLLVAAGGGLSSSDLAELTEQATSEVDRHLRAVSGRTFSSRDSRWRPLEGAQVFVLAHEELNATAVAAFGEANLGEYRDMIHAWADRYRDQGWPSGTPEYLLRGYHQLLYASGDLSRMVACAADQARLDRMLDMSGGDAAALAEILACQSTICQQERPDVYAMLLLARTREFLADRNANIPVQLPSVWAELGNPIRAEALARSITNPDSQAKALNALARALIKAGQLDHAKQVAQQADALIRSITDQRSKAQVLSALIVPLTQVGLLDRANQVAQQAETIARSLTSPYHQVQALRGLICALAEAGRPDRAEALARSITDLGSQPRTILDLANTLTNSGQFDRAEALAHSISDRGLQAWALRELTGALAAAGQFDRAEALAQSIADDFHQCRALRALAKALGKDGQLDRVKDVARQATKLTYSIRFPLDSRARELRDLARVLMEAGHFDAAEALARSITDSRFQAQALHDLIGALTPIEQFDRAEVLAQSIADPTYQARALRILASALGKARQLDRATQVAEQAQTIACHISDPESQARALRDLVGAFAKAEQFDRAEAIAQSIADPTHQARALRILASALDEAGQFDRAKQIAQRAQTIPQPSTDAASQAETLTVRARVLARAGELDYARKVARQAERVARSIASPDLHSKTMTTLVRALAETEQFDHAEVFARSITNPNCQAKALTALAMSLSKAGRLDHAVQFAQQAEKIARSITDVKLQSVIFRDLAGVFAQSGQLAQAEALAKFIVDPHILAEAITVIVAHASTSRGHQLLAWALTKVRSDMLLMGIAKGDPSTIVQMAEMMRPKLTPNEDSDIDRVSR